MYYILNLAIRKLVKRTDCNICNDISLEESFAVLAKNLPKWREFNSS
jgi:hypothetical protein